MTTTFEAGTEARHVSSDTRRSWWQRPLLIACSLFLLYLGLARFTDPGGYLSTDTGGKTATLEAMTERGDLDPDLGYWASGFDPDGSLYPMYRTQKYDEDRWVNVTTLPMIYLALPLYRLAGYDGALVIPMLGTVFAALAAGALSRRLGESDGVAATWIVGLASPAVVYALDFWEHSLGLALMAWAVIAAFDAVETRHRRRVDRAIPAILLSGLAGLGFGLAATMRQEAMIYGFVTGAAVVVLSARRENVRVACLNGSTMVAGAVAMIASNAALESAVLGSSNRTGRSTAAATGIGRDLGVRVEEALVTGAMPFGAGTLIGVLAAIGLVLALPALVHAVLNDRNPRPAGLAVGAIYLILLLDTAMSGLGFVPGLLATTPLAAAGLVAGRGWLAARLPFLVAVLSLPLVWAVQYTGGAGPQWGGRYVLLSGFLLLVVGVTALEGRAPVLLRALAGLSLLVCALGVLWTVQRTNAFADASANIAASDEPILVYSDPFLSREAGPLALEGKWLAAHTDALRAEAADVVRASGEVTFGYVNRERSAVPTFYGFVAAGERLVPLIGDYRLRVTTFTAAG